MRANPQTDPNLAFLLRVNVPGAGRVQIYAFDNLGWDDAGRVKLTCEVRHEGAVVFPRGQLHCALHGTSDGVEARELVLALVAMHPSAGGGEGEDYYADYTPDQLAWCEEYGEALDMEREFRYCDQDGNPKSDK